VARVEQAIEELGYVPNALARSLRFKQTRTIALILTILRTPSLRPSRAALRTKPAPKIFNVIFCNTPMNHPKKRLLTSTCSFKSRLMVCYWSLLSVPRSQSRFSKITGCRLSCWIARTRFAGRRGPLRFGAGSVQCRSLSAGSGSRTDRGVGWIGGHYVINGSGRWVSPGVGRCRVRKRSLPGYFTSFTVEAVMRRLKSTGSIAATNGPFCRE